MIMEEFIKNLMSEFDYNELLKLINGKLTQKDGETKIESDNGVVEIKETPNSFSIHIETKDNTSEDYNQKLIDYCEKIEDDDFFQEVCEHYDDVFGSIKELNDNTTLEGLKNFQKCVQDIALKKMKMYDDYSRLTF